MVAKQSQKSPDVISVFENDAKTIFPSLRKRVVRLPEGVRLKYQVTIPVKHYEKRKVRMIFFFSDTESHLKVFADGPVESKHRYEDNSLCIWMPHDPPNKKWIMKDGLLALLRHIELHLFREAYWRETSEWPGPEAH